jgi:hypothetical protein
MPLHAKFHKASRDKPQFGNEIANRRRLSETGTPGISYRLHLAILSRLVKRICALTTLSGDFASRFAQTVRRRTEFAVLRRLLQSAKIMVANYSDREEERSCSIFNWCGRSARKSLKSKTLQELKNSSACCKLSLKTIKKKFV